MLAEAYYHVTDPRTFLCLILIHRIDAPGQALDHDGPMPAFISRHRSFFILLAVVAAQILLLSLQITRNNHVRLIRYWAVEAFDPLERSLGGLMNVSSTAYRTYRTSLARGAGKPGTAHPIGGGAGANPAAG